MQRNSRKYIFRDIKQQTPALPRSNYFQTVAWMGIG